MPPFPTPFKAYIEAYLVDSQAPAYLILDPTHGLIDWGGPLEVYGLKELQYGQPPSGQLDFLQSFLPLQDAIRHSPRVTIQPGAIADVHLLQAEQQIWVLLLRGQAATEPYDPKQLQGLKSRFDQARQRGTKVERQPPDQQVEAFGMLTSSLAHEFNNLLGVVLGYAQLALNDLPPTHPVWLHVRELFSAGKRAQEVAQGVLAICRPSDLELPAVPLDGLVTKMASMIRAALPATIAIRQHLEPDTGPVQVNATQFYQLLMNLCLNAEYALRGQRGRLDIGVYTVEVTLEMTQRYPELQAGPYACLTVQDTGVGMDDATLAHIFDPFFTTKCEGEGTGLGLVIVRDIVTRHGGVITVESQPGQGATFSVYFPIAAAAPPSQ